MKRRCVTFAAPLIAALAVLLVFPGCESDEDQFDHTPPQGQGSIVVDNITFTDIEFYLNGILQDTVKSDDDKAFDLAPGVYRVVLNDAENGDRNWADDVDVLEGRLTLLTVTINTSVTDSFNVTREVQ
jgi:hypothetical protein